VPHEPAEFPIEVKVILARADINRVVVELGWLLRTFDTLLKIADAARHYGVPGVSDTVSEMCPGTSSWRWGFGMMALYRIELPIASEENIDVTPAPAADLHARRAGCKTNF
jgi:hypothetical protein